MKEYGKSLRFGILCDQNYLTVWEHGAVEKLLQMPNSSLELVIRVSNAYSEKKPGYNYSNHQLYKIYLKWLYKPSSLRVISVTDSINKAQSITCVAEEKTNYLHHLSDADVDRIEAAQLDFILHFAKYPIGGRLLTICRWGLWAFRYGDQQQYKDLSVCFWEIYNRKLVTVVSLCQVTNSSEDIVLKQGFFRTKLHSHSGSATSIYMECVNWPTDIIRQLVRGVLITRNQDACFPDIQNYPWPSNKQLLIFLARLVKYKFRNLYETFLRADQWNIGVVNRPINDFLHPERLQGATVETPLLPNRNVYYADCFVQNESADIVVYFELYDYRVRRGNISRLNYPWQANNLPTKVLEFPFHLSYPFLLGTYCMPEAWVTNSVRLYDLSQSAINANEGLVLLPDTPGIDSTLLEYNNRYWLFYMRADRDAMMNLFISYANSLEGPWHEHAQNPVKCDIRSSRPAGPFFQIEGRLYRPSQDCARDYGCGITVNEVVELSPISYMEKKAAYLTSLHPDYPDGIHTICAINETHTIIDFKRYRFIPFATLLQLWILISPFVYSKIRRRKLKIANNEPDSLSNNLEPK